MVVDTDGLVLVSEPTSKMATLLGNKGICAMEKASLSHFPQKDPYSSSVAYIDKYVELANKNTLAQRKQDKGVV